MSHVLELTDEQYQTLTEAARKRGQSADALIAQLIEELAKANREPQQFETEDWFRHLGASDEQIAEAERIARERSDANA
jgi:histone acetyltransferase (RNA polymerase elongator complex component)